MYVNVMQSPGSLIETKGRWLTGCDIDAVQSIIRSWWSGSGLMSVTSSFNQRMSRPFLQVNNACTNMDVFVLCIWSASDLRIICLFYGCDGFQIRIRMRRNPALFLKFEIRRILKIRL